MDLRPVVLRIDRQTVRVAPAGHQAAMTSAVAAARDAYRRGALQTQCDLVAARRWTPSSLPAVFRFSLWRE
jgi:hypothetical protein